MSTEIARHTPQASSIEMANMMAGATLLPAAYRKQPANLLFAFELADSLGVPRISALSDIHVIDGKPTASANLIGALVRKAGHKLRVNSTATWCEAVIIRADDPDFVPEPIRWDETRARQAGLWGRKGPWSQYPGQMLRARAVTEAARTWAPDALMGVVYTPEELGVEVDQDGAPVATVQSVAPVEPLPVAAPASLTERLQAKAAGVSAATAKRRLLDAVGGDRDTARALWEAHAPAGDTITDDELDGLLAVAAETDDVVDAVLVPDDPEPAVDGDGQGSEDPSEGVPANDAELWDDTPPAIPGDDTANADGEPMMTAAQSKTLHVLLRSKFDGASGPARFPILSASLSREIASTKDITKTEASTLIDAYTAMGEA